MMRAISRKTFASGSVLLVASSAAEAASTTGGIAGSYRWVTFLVFASVIALTMYVTYLSAKRVRSTEDFYAAGSSITGLQNGWAIA